MGEERENNKIDARGQQWRGGSKETIGIKEKHTSRREKKRKNQERTGEKNEKQTNEERR